MTAILQATLDETQPVKGARKSAAEHRAEFLAMDPRAKNMNLTMRKILAVLIDQLEVLEKGK